MGHFVSFREREKRDRIHGKREERVGMRRKRIPHRNESEETEDCLCWGLTTRQPLWVILCCLPEKGRKETEEIAEEMKERDREERGTRMKV